MPVPQFFFYVEQARCLFQNLIKRTFAILSIGQWSVVSGQWSLVTCPLSSVRSNVLSRKTRFLTTRAYSPPLCLSDSPPLQSPLLLRSRSRIPESCNFVLTGDRGWGFSVSGQFAKSLQGQHSGGMAFWGNTTGMAQRAQGLISHVGVSSSAIVSLVPCK